MIIWFYPCDPFPPIPYLWAIGHSASRQMIYLVLDGDTRGR